MPKTKQLKRFESDLVRLGMLGAGEEMHTGASMAVGGRTFRWLSVGVQGVESVIQADYYAKTFTAKRRYILELNEQTGEVIHVHAKQLTGFKVPHPNWKDFAAAVGLEEDPHVFWLYWTAGGDEMMVGHRVNQGLGEFDGNWPVWMELQRLNPNVIAPLLGSSEEDGTHVLLFEHQGNYWDPPNVYLAEKKFIYDYYTKPW